MEISQSQNTINCTVTLIGYSGKGKTNKGKSRSVSGCQQLGRGERLTTKRQHEGTWGDDETVLCYNYGSGYKTIFLSKFIQQKE